jgi:signal transduction histidine kinase/DNA-binding response OmpR family regulator
MRSLDHIFPGVSEMAQRMRDLDWSQTPLGPAEKWPQSLQTSVGTCLDCAFPIVLWWGPELAILYNDEYRPILGTKHPRALGAPGLQVWAEIRDVIAPMLAQVMERAEATRSRDLLLHIDRHGYPEEAYFSFSYSPIHDERGKIGGVFCPVIETTEKVIGERRLRTLRDLAAESKGAESETSAYRAASRVLAANPHDVPFALIYRIEDDGKTALLETTAGIAPGSVAAPQCVPLDGSPGGGRWSLGAVAQSGRAQVLTDLSRESDVLPMGAWSVPPRTVIVLPMLLPGQDRPRAVLVAAISPMRELDEDYLTFFGLVGSQIAAGLADARALEEERRRAEQLAEIDCLKTAFFSNVSHEFRTPLTLMLGPLEDVLASGHGALSDAAETTLRVAHRNSLRLLKLVNSLLDFSRIEAGRIEASYEPTDLAAITAELSSVFRSAIEKAGLRLVVEAPALPEPVYVDRDLWEKVVLNLLSNAFKFTFEGEIRVSLRSCGSQVELEVADTGVGIPPADLPKIFQRFHRVRNARSRSHEGTGIGLALVQELVKLHGGEVIAESEEGHGTRFVVRIPTGSAHLPAARIAAPRALGSTRLGAGPFVEEALRWQFDVALDVAPVRDVTAALAAPAAAVAPAHAPRARVLLADDNADMRDYLRNLLERQYEFTAVADGEAALESIRRDPPDLVLADVMMPRLDGFELLAAIRADERTRSLPIIMLSARAGEESRIEGLSAGADDYLIKPFSARELLARIGSQLELTRLRREVNDSLRQRSEQVQALVDRAPLGVYLLDPDLRIAQLNPVAAEMFGDIPGGVAGRSFEEIVRTIWKARYADEILRIFRHTLETGESHETARAQLRIDRGLTEYYSWRLERITLPDGRNGLVCYFWNVSEQVSALQALEESREALKEAGRRKDEFLATLAHELRNPLAPIRNGLQIARLASHEGRSTERIQEMIERQVDQMVRLVDDLMDVSRITRGRIELRKEPIELSVLVWNAVETSRPLIAAARHQLSVAIPDESLIVYADSVRITQVIVNLLNNAAKYTAEGGRIWLTVRREESEAIVSVRDDGIGIPAGALLRIFEPFAQADQGYDRARGGLGIGLTLARRLVEMHGGTVHARSEGEGQGSEFVIRLPTAVGRAVPQDLPMPATRPTRGPGRILVVDDNRDAADSTAMILRMLGSDVRVVNDGPSALEVIEDFRPSVVLLDIGMPGMDGYEVARRVRERRGSEEITLVALTGWGHDEQRRLSQEAGIDHHLVKPLEYGALVGLLDALTAGSSITPTRR